MHLSATNPIQRVEGAYSAVAAFDNFVYVIHGESVKKYAVETESFTSFEICAKSDSLHRLNGATTAYLSGETLYIADNGNHRVSVYNTAENTFLQPFNATLPITFLSADENSLLTANENQAVIHSLNPTANEEKSFVNFNGKIVGAVNVYGKYYLTTTSNYFYCLSKNDNGEWSIAECKKTSTRYPKLLTADAYGTLYILSGNDVYSFTEETFMQAGETGETAFTSIPADATQISVDYERNLYALSGDTLYHSHRGGAGESFSFSNPLVYYPEQSTPQINAFAFGIENNQTYVLCDNSYLLVSERMQLPTVKNIAVDGADESIFANTSAQFTVVKTTQNALLIEFDVSSLQGASVFPYMQYERSSEEKTALKIGTANEYDLLAYFDREQNKYRTYLVLSSACTSLPNDEYCVIYDETEQKIGYLTNAVPLYKFPYLTDLLTAGQLPRGAQVTVLGEINELDHAYYHVSYVDENGVEKTGYVPQTYITEFSGLPPQSDLHESGATESDFDSVWRFAYLLLGFGAICILVDFLILRKKGDND